MKHLAWAWVVIALVPRPSAAQSFYDSFDSPASSAFAEASSDWTAVWEADPWTSARNLGGVCPVTDTNGPGQLGAPVDAFENAIVAGQDTWRDYAVEASFYALDNDGLGLVVRYTSADSFYLVVSSRHEMPTPNGSEPLSAAQTRLYRISAGQAELVGEPATTAYTGQTFLLQRMRVEVTGSRVRVFLGAGASPLPAGTVPVLDLEDTNSGAPTAGRAGLYAFAMGSGLPGTYFDTFRVAAMDSDGDGKSNDDELKAGTNPYDGDSDDDGVADGDEFRWTEDADGDGLVNALDPDADNDGLPDGLEQGITVAHPDTDLDAGHFIPDADPSSRTNHLVADTDHGGALDGEEDANRNGRVDHGERDPLVAEDDDLVDTGTGSETGTVQDTGSETHGPTDSDTVTASESESDTATIEDTAGEPRPEHLGPEGFYGGPACDCGSTGRRGLASPGFWLLWLWSVGLVY